MNLFNVVAKLLLDSSEYEEGMRHGEKTAKSFGDHLKGGLAVAGKVAAVGIAAAGAAAIKLGKAALESYADYEQLVGGVETLFKENADQVVKYAQNAYKTAGLSANDYMETVTSFSASLLQSLGGDTAKATEYADLAITDMSDNANKMGSSMESIQNAYQGFAKQNYTMLDNLKLGYGGTKSEMERLVTDAERLNSSFRATRDANGKLTLSFGDIVEAIHIVQDDMGIAGTTAEEASRTISGSVNSMKAAWSNLVVGLADDQADFDTLVNNFVDSAVTAGENIIPRVQVILKGLGNLLTSASSTLVPMVVTTITDNLPMIVESGIQIIVALAGALVQAIPQLVAAIPQIFDAIVNGFRAQWPAIQQAGVELLSMLGNGIMSMLGNIGVIAQNVVTTIWNKLIGLGSMGWNWGSDLMSNFIGGIQAWWGNLVATVSNIASVVRSYIGFSEPEKGPLSNFHTYAPDMMKLFAKGIEDNSGLIEDAFNDTLDIQSPAVNSGISTPASVPAKAKEIILNITQTLDGAVLARNQYRYNLDEADRHGDNLVNAYA